MTEYKTNELEEFEHPYELEYSSLKSSKNESLKVQTIKENKSNNLLGINNNNNNKLLENNKNINVQKNNIIKNNNIDTMKKKIQYIQGNNYRLNEINKKNIENFIGINANINNITNINYNKKKSKSKDKKINKKINNNTNNINIYSTVNDYWENREKKNKVKMEKIKKERDQKKYGEIYPIPKINKNTQDIIEKIKERIYNTISEEEQKEDEINKNVPIKMKLRNIFFENHFNSKSFRNSIKSNKSSSKLRTKNYYNNLMKIKINNKRTKTPNQKKLNKRKITMNSNKIISMANIKNYEAIMKLRNDEEYKKMKELEEKIKIENSYEEMEMKEVQDKNSTKNIKIIEERKTSEELGEKIENYLNKSLNLFSLRNKNNKDFSNINKNINELIISRKYLNNIYNNDKKITNHSFIHSNSICGIQKCSDQRNIEIFYRNKPKIKKQKSKTIPKLNKTFNLINSFGINKSDRELKNISLYDSRTKCLKYKHYTEKDVYPYNRANISVNNNQLNQINNIDDSTDKINQKVAYFNPKKQKINNGKKCEIINKINKIYDFSRDKKDQINDITLLSAREYINKNNQINKIQNELEEKSLLNEELLNEVENLKKNNQNEYKNIILKNESINKIYNELDNESLLRYRQENSLNLYELNLSQRNNNNKNQLNIYLENRIEESKNLDNRIGIEKYKKINSQKFKNILNCEQQKIENNLDYLNKELKINTKKKELLLNKMFGDDYTKKLKINKKKYNESNTLNNKNIKDSYGVDKYLVKNNVFNENQNNNENEFNKYKFIYSPFKMTKGIKDEIKKGDLLNIEEDNIIGKFEFHRKHHFE